jgi:TolB protein
MKPLTPFLILKSSTTMKTFKLLFLIMTSVLFTCCEESTTIQTRPQEDTDFVPVEKTDTKIVFISRRIENSADWNLLAMNLDGSEQTKLTELTVRCEQVVLSHSSQSILFVHYSDDYFYELYSINVDGTNLKLIDRANRYCGSPDWSKDDSKIIYSKNRDESTDESDLILFDVMSNTKQIVADVDNNISGRFSKDDKIVFSSGDYRTNDIYLMDQDGSNKQKIISNAGAPVWSPDGRTIAYVSKGVTNTPQIFVSSFDGSDVKQLTSTALESWDSGYPNFGNHSPQWTPDGKQIVYVSEINGGLPEIYIMNNDGSGQTRLTHTDRRNENPRISGDGNYIYFASNRDLTYGSDIFIMQIDGKGQNPLTKYAGDDTFPVTVTADAE